MDKQLMDNPPAEKKAKEPKAKSTPKSVFEQLNSIDVKDHIEKKNGLNYLSWAFAWAETKKKFPTATYQIKLFGENQLPYVYDENTGYMVFTSVTINDLTHDMWLPVMDGANKTMKKDPYTYDTKYKKGVRVESATMFDINKTIMRCLVKNIAMFGLGLYIFAGEDLPLGDDNSESEKSKLTHKEKISLLIQDINAKYKDNSGKLISNICLNYNIKSLFELTEQQLQVVRAKL